jgi:hypothetical protein
VISEYGTQAATIIYALYMLLLGLANLAIWTYASRGARLIDPDMNLQSRRRETLRAASVPAVFAFSILLAFIHANLAKLSWVLVAVALQWKMDEDATEGRNA